MQSYSYVRSRCGARDGLALIMVLAFIVLLTILVVSYITFSGLNHNSTASYSKSIQAQEIAQGGLQDILSDLHTEIAAGSFINATTYAANGGPTVYIPSTNYAAVPARAGYDLSSWGTDYNTNVGSTHVDFLSPSLIRVSRRSQDSNPNDFYPNFCTNAYFDTTTIAGLTNRASASSTATPSANSRYVSIARWNKTFLLAPTTATNTSGTYGSRAIPGAFSANYTPSTGAALGNGSLPPYGPPDWVYVTRAGSLPLSASQLANALPSNNLTNITTGSGTSLASPVIGRYAYVMYDEGALLDANVAGYPHVATNIVSATNFSGISQDTIEKSYTSYADLTQIGLYQTNIDSLVAYRNASVNPTNAATGGNSYLTNVLSTYAKNGFLSFTNNGTVYDSPFVNRQDLINYFTTNDANFNTATALTALPHLGTFTRDANTPSYYPPSDSAGIANYLSPSLGLTGSTQTNGYYNASGNTSYANFGYRANMDTDGYPNRDLANVRFHSTFTSVTHYDDNAVGHAYAVSAGDTLLQSRFSLAKINWLSQTWAGQSDPGTDNPSYSSSKYPAAIKACFGLVWDYPAGVSGTEANGGNKCWNYVGSSSTITSASGLQSVTSVPIETLDQVAAEGREPNFFEMLKAAILNGSLGKSPGVSAWNNGQSDDHYGTNGDYDMHQPPPSDNADSGPAGMFCYSYDGHTAGTTPTAFAPYQYPDCQIIQIGANIIDQFDSDNYPTAIYFKYGGEGSFDSVNRPGIPSPYLYSALNGNTTNGAPNCPIYGPVNMFYGDENLPELHAYYVDYCSAPALSGGGANTAVDWATLSGGGTTNLSGFVQPEIWNPHQQPNTNLFQSGQEYEMRAYGAMYFTWTWANTHFGPPVGWPTGATGRGGNGATTTWYTGNTNSEANAAGTVFFTDASTTSSFYNHPYLLTKDSIPTYGAAQVSVTQGTGSGQTSPMNVAQSTYPYYNVNLTNHFAGFYMGSTFPNNTNGAPNLEFYTDSSNGANSVTMYVSFFPYNACGSGSQALNCNSFALGWVDSNSSFHPYSFMNGVFCQDYASPNGDSTGINDNRNGGVDPQSTGGTGEKADEYNTLDCRTTRFSPLFGSGFGGQKAIGATIEGASGSRTAFPTTPDGYGFYSGTPAAAYTNSIVPGDFQVNSTWLDATQGETDTGTSHAFYTDPDGVVRPADGFYANKTTGDGQQLYTSSATPANKPAGTSYAVGDNTLGDNVSHGRRPVILNRPFRSVGELGYAFRDLPFKTLDFFSQSSADAALLDMFSITDEATVGNNKLSAMVAGHVDINNAPVPILNAILKYGAKKEDFDTNYYMNVEVPAISTNVAAMVNPANAAPLGPILNRANIVTELMQGNPPSGVNTAGSPSIIGSFTSSPDLGNKAYLEAPVRALANVTNTRTWNLLIDIIAQSGHLVPNATSLDNFVVEGEKRYWLHIAIDRYTGKIVDQQLEPVYE